MRYQNISPKSLRIFLGFAPFFKLFNLRILAVDSVAPLLRLILLSFDVRGLKRRAFYRPFMTCYRVQLRAMELMNLL